MTLVTRGRDVLLEAVFAVELAVLLNEADVLQWTSAGCVHADEVLRAPDAAQSGNERSSVQNNNQLGERPIREPYLILP